MDSKTTQKLLGAETPIPVRNIAGGLDIYQQRHEGHTAMTDEQIKHMVNRFLGWRLPKDFQPDAGISFKAECNEGTPWLRKHEPTGTNLFTADQAEAMVRYLVEGLPQP
jgi:hypothetical protein